MINRTEYLDIKLVSEANSRDHWAKKANRVREQRKAAFYAISGPFDFPLTVRLIRVYGPMRRPYDDDNLRGSFKAVRDGIAERMRINDNDPRVTWEYEQRKGNKDCIGVSVIEQPAKLECNHG